MSVVPFLLNAEEIRQCVVECTLYISLFSPAISEVGSHCPSPFVEAGCVGVHRTHGVVAVRSAQSDAVSWRHTACAEVVVVASRCATHREGVSLERQRIVHVACLLVQTAHERIAELSALHIIGQHAIDIDIVVFLVKSTITETYRREQIARFRCVNVRVWVHDGDIIRHIIIFAQLCFGKREGRLVHAFCDSSRGFGILRKCQRTVTECQHCKFQLFLHNTKIKNCYLLWLQSNENILNKKTFLTNILRLEVYYCL